MLKFFLLIYFVSFSGLSLIAPECAAVQKSSKYNEDFQRAFMQNYYNSLFVPLPIASLKPSGKEDSIVGIDLTYIRKLTCQERLVLDGTKTENTAKSPILPAPKIFSNFLHFSKFTLGAGITAIPPIPFPNFKVWFVASQIKANYEFWQSFSLDLRLFMGIGYLKAEIAGPFNESDPIKDDYFNFANMGTDLTASYTFSLPFGQAIQPFGTIGLISGASNFIVTDDSVPIFNEKYPLISLTFYGGLNYLFVHEKIQLGLLFGGSYKYKPTTHISLAYKF